MTNQKKDIENRDDIEKLVRRFYAKVIPDDLIGSFFIQTIKVNWETHLPKMYDFWEDLVFGTTKFSGNPMQAHIHVHSLEPMKEEHFERWLKLFRETLDENFSGPVAEKAMQRAISIATVIRIKTKD
jgi:hemoglobin